MEEDIKRLEEKMDAQQKRLDQIYKEVRLFKRNGLIGLTASIIMFLIPIIGLTIYIQKVSDIFKNFIPHF